MNANNVINQTVKYVQEAMSGESSGHDWWHVYRVWQTAKHIAQKEPGANMLVVELGSLLHDIADWKFHDGNEDIGPETAGKWLDTQQLEPSIIKQVTYIVRHISYKGGTNKHTMKSLEGQIVQDADRLDALGAIGIGRAFAYGGSMQRSMHEPDKKPKSYANFEDFKDSIKTGTTINHFYEKLLKLKDGMHTATARQLATERHEFMERYLAEFFAEWEGKR